jgi:hypothetical protein
MIITNYGSYLGKPRLTLTRSGNTLTVKAFGAIPNNLKLCMCYSTLSRQRRGRFWGHDGTHSPKKNRGRKAFTIRGDSTTITSGGTRTFTLTTPHKFTRLLRKSHYSVRAELRGTGKVLNSRTRYVSNILYVTV